MAHGVGRVGHTGNFTAQEKRVHELRLRGLHLEPPDFARQRRLLGRDPIPFEAFAAEVAGMWKTQAASHTTIDLPRVLERGIDDIRREASGHLP